MKKIIIISMVLVVLIALMELVFYFKLAFWDKDLQEQRKAFLENQSNEATDKATDCVKIFENRDNNGLDVKG